MGLKRKYGLTAGVLLAMAGFMGPVSSASAADFGGNCCADLEERIAELEATTARKGNRKVSLTISGWISEGVMWWDDGTESNVYQSQDSTDLASNVSFSGSAQINADWSAGYMIRIFLDHSNALFQNQDNDDLNFGVNVQFSYWWLESKQLGKLSVGLQSGAGDNTAILTDFTGTLFTHNNVTFEAVSFFLTPSGGTRSAAGTFGGTGGSTLGMLVNCNSIRQGIAQDCFGDRTNAVRYDSPTWGGLGFSVSWGEDDRYEGALRYAGEGGGFKYSFAVGYAEVNGDNDFTGNRVDFTGAPIDSSYFQVGGTIKHLNSNLWVHATYSEADTDNVALSHGDGYAYYIKAGWSPKLNPLGRTHFVGEYRQNIDTYGASYQLNNPGAGGAGQVCDAFGGSGGAIGAACGAAAGIVNVTGSEVTGYGVGLVQEIDAASMNLWIKYRHYDIELDYLDAGNAANAGTQEFNDIDLIFAGAHIFF